MDSSSFASKLIEGDEAAARIGRAVADGGVDVPGLETMSAREDVEVVLNGTDERQPCRQRIGRKRVRRITVEEYTWDTGLTISASSV
jgi:hypothetical protein